MSKISKIINVFREVKKWFTFQEDCSIVMIRKLDKKEKDKEYRKMLIKTKNEGYIEEVIASPNQWDEYLCECIIPTIGLEEFNRISKIIYSDNLSLKEKNDVFHELLMNSMIINYWGRKIQGNDFSRLKTLEEVIRKIPRN